MSNKYWIDKTDGVDTILAENFNSAFAGIESDITSVDASLERIKYYGSADIIPSDESYFTVNGTGETITGLTDTGKTQTELVIPYVINGILITQIRENCFLANKSITKVIIPNSVTSIGYEAFAACTSLTSINIPNSVISISMNAFNGCSSLTSINIPNSVTSIWQSAFNSCMSLTSLNIPKSVTSIAGSAFSGCPNLTIYCEQGSAAETYAKANNIPVIYTEVKAEVIDNKADKSTTLSGYGITDAYTKGEIDSKISNVYEIKGSSTVANLPTNPEVGDVYNVTDSGTITGTEIVLSAGDNVVYTSDGWDKLAATVDLSNYQEKLIFDTTPTIDSSNPVTSGGIKTALDGKADKATTLNDYGIIDAYTKIEIDNKENVLKLADERIKYYGDKDIVPSDESYFTVNGTGETITGLTDTGKTQYEFVIPYKINGVTVTQIGQSCFNDMTDISKIIIPNSSVTSIGQSAFSDCIQLTSINIPNGVTSIGYSAFNGCTSLTSINIPNSVTRILGFTFSGCTSLTSVNIPNSVTSIGDYAFYHCTSLTSINIPNSVTSIGNEAFSNCYSLTSINIPNSVTSIGNSVFDECTNLTIYCEQGSAAETYAKANNIPVVYTEVSESYVRNLRPYVKNTISAEEALSLNTIYDIGVQNDLTLILPTAEVGNFIQVDFLSGATAATLTVSASSSALLSDYDFTPEPNMIYSLFFDYGVLGYDETAQSNIYGWRFNYAEYTYTPDGSEG